MTLISIWARRRWAGSMSTCAFQFRIHHLNPSAEPAWALFYIHAANEARACEEAQRLNDYRFGGVIGRSADDLSGSQFNEMSTLGTRLERRLQNARAKGTLSA